MNLLKNTLFYAVIVLCANPVYATVFQYFDEDGTLIVTDSPYGIRQVKQKPSVTDRYSPKIPKLNYKEDIHYDYYPVTGRTLQEIVSSTNMNGPFDSKENRNYPAQTRWRLGWSYNFDYSYRIDDAFVHVALNIFDINFNSDITVILPMISENIELNPQDYNLWGNYLKGLLEHEHDHVRIINDPSSWDKAQETISGIKELTLPYDRHNDLDSIIKSTVEAETGKIGHDLMKTIKMKNDEYDRLTEHGLKPEMGDIFFKGQ